MQDSAFPVSNQFKKQERLCSNIAIEKLFKSNNHLFIYPFKVLYYLQQEQNSCNKVLISVPKRNFKKAVDRNLLKRRIREAYRINKHQIESDNKNQLNLGFIYVAKQIISYEEIKNAIQSILNKLIEIKTS